LSLEEYAKATVEILGFKGKFDLSLDRSNWKYGKKEINYLVLSWRINRHISIPLMFTELDKAGNSNTDERLDLLEKFNKIFGFDRIKSLAADREFIGKKWFNELHKHDIPYFIRVKENTLLSWGEDNPIHAREFFRHLQGAQNRLIQKEMYGSIVYFAGARSKVGGLVIVMSNQDLKSSQILAKYRERWAIEELFRKLKTSGFHWENTHMIHSPRLISLLIILSFGVLIACLMGQEQKIPWKKTLDYPLYSVFKHGLVRFQFLLAQSVIGVLETLTNLLNLAKNEIF
jgi:hypothetical protein